MKRLSVFILIILLFLSGCSQSQAACDIVATTLPVYDFTVAICEDTGLEVGRLVTENVSCLHDYTLKVSQMRMVESATAVVQSGAGLELFLEDALQGKQHIIDASVGVHMHETAQHDHEEDHDHHHDADPHIWLSPENAKIMAKNICSALSDMYPARKEIFHANLEVLFTELDALQNYGKTHLSSLTCREMITFHDGFGYFAESYDLTILDAIEEESGSEASAAEIIHLVNLINDHHLPAVFTEVSGSDACAGIIHAETGAAIYSLDMAMSGDSYFDAMYHNIDTVKEALG